MSLNCSRTRQRSRPFRNFAVVLLFAGSAIAAAPDDLEELIVKHQKGNLREAEGEVKFQRAPEPEKEPGKEQPLIFGDALRTLELARAVVALEDKSEVRLKPVTRLMLAAQDPASESVALRVFAGEIYMLNRATKAPAIIEGPGTKAIPKGTEFLFRVEGNKTEVTMFDGEAVVSNDVETKIVPTGTRGTAVPGKPIDVRPLLKGENIIQWWIYYPAVLDPDELGLSPAEQSQLAASLGAYRSGDLQAALQKLPGYPTPAEPTSEAQRIYFAGLNLAVGGVDRTEAQLAKVSSNAPLAAALRTMIAAVQYKVGDDVRNLTNSVHKSEITNQKSSSELLALSYHHQCTNGLKEALHAARLAVERSPTFGFGWARVAELEFSFGYTRAAREAIQRALDLSPRNAQAHALNGFLLAAENRTREGIAEFDEAIRIDPALGNAWLGRGLGKRRLGWSAHIRNEKSEIRNSSDWLSDIITAAILEPTRSLARSYAGKAFSEIGNERLAEQELAFAQKLDPNDPTPWLYSALLNRQENRINEAISDLEASQERNNNRALFHSRLLLDEDRAVRSANLAAIYRDAGMNEVSLREAARAVSYDYANYSAHLFLSDSYNELRDPTRFNLRYETVWFNELLLANLFSPVGGTPLSQRVSQQEYTKLFEANRIGLSTDTQYRSDGQVREAVSQFGRRGATAWALDLDYQHNDGIRPNNALERLEWYATIKHQLTWQDSILLLTTYQDYHSGDNYQRYDQSVVRTNLSLDEFQHPWLALGYHREWQPGVHTLLLAARLQNEQRFSDTAVKQLVLSTNTVGQITNVQTLGLGSQGQDIGGGMDVSYRSRLEIYSGEWNQIFQAERNGILFGGRYQRGDFLTDDLLTNVRPPAAASLFENPPAQSNVSAGFERASVFAYDTLKPFRNLFVTAGCTYDRIVFPANFRSPPISAGELKREQVGPKAAAVWSPVPEVTVRAAFSRSLGGASLDESFRLEPTQLAGFSQSFRSIISESIVGSVAAPAYEVIGGALDLKLPTRTYVGLQGGLLRSDVSLVEGAFRYNGDQSTTADIGPSSIRKQLNYTEPSISFTINQIVGDEWSFGAEYKFTHSELHTVFPEVPTAVLAAADRFERAQLHQASLFALYNHPSGFFARAETDWYHQQNFGYSPSLPTEDFYQHNFFVGYRFRRQHGEISIGVLNLTDTDYRLNPLTLYSELPRQRAFVARLRINL